MILKFFDTVNVAIVSKDSIFKYASYRLMYIRTIEDDSESEGNSVPGY